ncbi:AEC family transporter [Bacillus sp. CECT 9360]|uniref:AEC family transporter n=1 Tax=Bacillus sp. CECT 9360 TaxID=2845821 RepID=UPI001E348620|nr:AEC family transporter [Bacillus sp. CECT 9360]CAH0343863.1 hypothetical protein BCI9360_00089 [Bacillus sp. CECT 9360]
MEIKIVLSSISIMAIIILIGIIIARNYIITDQAKQLLVIIIINVAVPSIILNGIFNTNISEVLLSKMLIIFLLSICFNILGVGLGWLSAIVFGYRTIKARYISILAGIGNTGFIGIPVCAALFGPTGGLLAAIYDAGLDVIVFTVVLMLLQKNEQFSLGNLKAFINIPFIAVIVGILIAIFGYEPPIVLRKLTATLSSLAAPLAMLYIGFLINSFLKEKRKIPIGFVSISLLIKLVIFPLIIIAILKTIPVIIDVKLITVIQVSMPTFTLATVLFARYAQDEEKAVVTTVLSTIFSIITVPIIVYTAGLFL